MRLLSFPPTGFVRRTTRRRRVWVFTQRLRSLIASGVPEAEAVRIIVKDIPQGRLARRLKRSLTKLGFVTIVRAWWDFPRVLNKVAEGLESGLSVSEAFAKFPRYFSAPYVAIVAAGERSGDLGGALALAAESVRPRDVRLDRIVLGTAIPLIAVAGAYPRLHFLAQGVWPALAETPSEIGEPAVTAARVALMSDVVASAVKFWFCGMLAVVLAFGAFFLYPAVKSLTLYRFCLLLRVMLGANVSMEECSRLASRLSPWFPYRRAVKKLFRKVEEGKDLATAFASVGYFPPELKWLMAAGQCRDDIPGALSSAAAILGNKSDSRFSRLLDVCPPLLTILTAIPVAALGVALFSVFQWLLDSLFI